MLNFRVWGPGIRSGFKALISFQGLGLRIPLRIGAFKL